MSDLSHMPRPLPILITLLLLMAATRFEHVSYMPWVLALPDASWAIFLLGGFYLSRWNLFSLFFLVATTIDLVAVGWGGVSAACINSGYLFLVPSYALLWQGGRLCRQLLVPGWSAAIMVPVALLSITAAFVLSNLGHYWFAAGIEPGLAAYALAVAPWLWIYTANIALYLGLAAVAHMSWLAAGKAGQRSLSG